MTLPKGKYISISYKENEKDEVINKLKDFVFKKYNFVPNEIVVLVKVIGIKNGIMLFKLKFYNF